MPDSLLIPDLLTVAGFLALLGLLTFCAKRLKFASLKKTPASPIKFSATKTLGKGAMLAIVEVENQRVLVGCTPHSISKIAHLAPPQNPEQEKTLD